MLGQRRRQRLGHLTQFLDAPADAVVLPQPLQGLSLRHARGAEELSRTLGQSGRGALHQAKANANGKIVASPLLSLGR